MLQVFKPTTHRDCAQLYSTKCTNTNHQNRMKQIFQNLFRATNRSYSDFSRNLDSIYFFANSVQSLEIRPSPSFAPDSDRLTNSCFFPTPFYWPLQLVCSRRVSSRLLHIYPKKNRGIYSQYTLFCTRVKKKSYLGTAETQHKAVEKSKRAACRMPRVCTLSQNGYGN